MTSLVLPRPPGLPPSTQRAVDEVLRRLRATCLERSLVSQRWLAAQGISRDLLIGVRVDAGRFSAHAWLEGEPELGRFEEILRLAGRTDG